MRDEAWLQKRLENMWGFLFPEVERKNKVKIYFKGRWRNKFGHITKNGRETHIVINSLFKDERVPEYVIDVTIAHELIHYMHGFHSPHKQQFRHPHQGGVVTKEIKERGFSHMLRKEREFFKRDWQILVDEFFPKKN